MCHHPRENKRNENTVDSLHNSILLSISEHCFVISSVERAEKYCCLFPFYWKEENKKVKKDDTITWHGWCSQCCCRSGKHFSRAFFKNKSFEGTEKPFMRTFRDAWREFLWITFYLESFVQWENFDFQTFALHEKM